MNKPVLCRRCRRGHMQTIEHVETFHPPTGTTVEVRQLSARCDACGKENVLASQVEENLRLRAARKAHYGEYLLGEDISEFRRHWGLTQRQFSKVLGRGIIAFSRLETEKSYPDLTLNRLLKVVMRNPLILKELADDVGIPIPFWEAHCQAERGLKLKFIQHVGQGLDPRSPRGSTVAGRRDTAASSTTGSMDYLADSAVA